MKVRRLRLSPVKWQSDSALSLSVLLCATVGLMETGTPPCSGGAAWLKEPVPVYLTEREPSAVSFAVSLRSRS